MAYRQLCAVTFAVLGLLPVACGGESTAGSVSTGTKDQAPSNADQPPASSSSDRAPSGSSDQAPSNLAVIGRYIIKPEIFQILESQEPGSGGEIQLTDALKYMLRNRPIYGLKFEGTRYDAGDKLGFLRATVEFALNRHDLGQPFREYLKKLCLDQCSS